MKPTFGSISRYGVFPVAHTLDTMGFFTRTVADAAALMSVLSGADDRDPTTAYAPTVDYTHAIDHPRPPRIGVLRRMFESRADSETLGHVDDVLGRLADMGAAVVEVNTRADFDALLAAHRVTMAVEAASVHEADFSTRPNDYGPKLTAMIPGRPECVGGRLRERPGCTEDVPPRHGGSRRRRGRPSHAVPPRRRRPPT